ncbi:MAG: glycosyltransferase family 4 protein, partial [Anaerolineae bacterium]
MTRSTPMLIWLVNPFDPVPGEALRPGRYAFLTKMLAQRGHRVIWLTSNFFHTTKTCRASGWTQTEPQANLRVVMLPTPPYYGNISIRRVWNHTVYSKRIKEWASRQSDLPGLILASCPPLSSARAAVALARQLGAKSVVDVQDLWPDVFSMLLPRRLSKAGEALLYPLSRYAAHIHAHADGLVAVCQTYLAKSRASRPNRDGAGGLVMHLGVDLHLFDKCSLLEEATAYPKGGDEFRIAYIGTVGKSYDVATILEAARHIKFAHSRAVFFIVGNGPELARMRATATHMQLDNVFFTGFIPFEQMVKVLVQSDVGLNARARGLPETFPNKVFDYLAAGLPIVNSVHGELGQLVRGES